MPNPGSFRGSRKEFLAGEKVSYSLGVVGGYAAEALALIQRRYFKRYPPDLNEDEEPNPEHLATINDDSPDPETSPPDEDKMTPEEFSLAMTAMKERQEKVRFKKAQIKRWLIYQHVKATDVKPKETNPHNPFNSLVNKLSGKEVNKPRMRTAANVWRKDHRTEIEEEAKATSERDGLKKSDQAALRDRIARHLFLKLSQEEQEHWATVARDLHADAMAQWKKDVEHGVSSTPENRQRSIQALVHFMQPVLDAVCASTGWKASFFAGGPEPAQNGKLNMISIHSGTTSGPVKMTFGRSERVDIKKHLIPMYGTFLQKCYSPEECRLRALCEDGFIPMAETNLENPDATVHSIGLGSTMETQTSSCRQTAALINSSIPDPTSSHLTVSISSGSTLNESATNALSSTTEDTASQFGVSSPEDTSPNPFPFDMCRISEPPASPLMRPLSPPHTPPNSRPATPAPSPLASPLVVPVSQLAATEGDNAFPAGAHLSSIISTSKYVPSSVWHIINNAISAPITALEVTAPTPLGQVPNNENAEVVPQPPKRRPGRPAKKTGSTNAITAPVPHTVESSSTGRRSSRIAVKETAAASSVPPTKKGSGKRVREALVDVQPADDVPPAKRTRKMKPSPVIQKQAASKSRRRKA